MSCYDYLKCGQTECTMYSKEDGPQCWEVDGTLCIHHVIAEVRHELSGMEKKGGLQALGLPVLPCSEPQIISLFNNLYRTMASASYANISRT